KFAKNKRPRYLNIVPVNLQHVTLPTNSNCKAHSRVDNQTVLSFRTGVRRRNPRSAEERFLTRCNHRNVRNDSKPERINRMTNNPWRRERPLAVAHRGHSIEYPENTFEAYRKAIELGAEMIECDVNMTRDGVLVMMHDYTLDRTTNGTGRVNQATWDDIQSLDAGKKFNPQFAGARVPLTKDTIQLFREAGIYGCFEVKGGNAETAKEIASALIDLFVKENALETNLMSSYYHEALALAKARVPDLQLAPERLPDDAPPDPPEAVRQAKALHSQILQYQYTVMTPEVVRILHDNDIAVWSWSTTDEPSLVFSIDVGADAVMGDDVRLMIEVLNRMRPIGAPSQVSQAPA